MSKYVISVNYDATYVAEVDANDEGDALGKARQMAEEADVREFADKERERGKGACKKRLTRKKLLFLYNY